MTNTPDSALTTLSDATLIMAAGPEKAVAATKSFSNTFVGLHLLGIWFSALFSENRKTLALPWFGKFFNREFEIKKSRVNKAEDCLRKEVFQRLVNLPDLVQMTLDQADSQTRELAKLLFEEKSIYVLGAGDSLPFAREVCLKMKEGTYIHAEAFIAGNFSHGPMALVDGSGKEVGEKTKVIVFATENEHLERTLMVVREIQKKGGWVAVATDLPDLEQRNVQPDFLLTTPYLKHFGSYLAFLPFQILITKIAELKGIDIDNPKNITKFIVLDC